MIEELHLEWALYSLLQSKLIPRIISIVGIIGYTLVLFSGPLDLLGIIETGWFGSSGCVFHDSI